MNAAIEALKQRNPAQYDAIRAILSQPQPQAAPGQSGQIGGPSTWDDAPEGANMVWNSGGGGNLGFGGLRDVARGNIGGFDGWRDMIDGGGAGQSGGWRGSIFG